jgi:hypothetical protein
MAEPAPGAAAVECAENENKSLDVSSALSTVKFLRSSCGLESVTGYNSCSRDMKRSRGIRGRLGTATKKYFARLPNGRYARFSIKFYAGDRNFIVFESYLNPKPGSRNLEFDSQKTVKVR